MTTTTKPTERLILTAAERRVLLEEDDSYPRGDARRGALLRRHGLYTSQMATWRARLQRGAAALDAQGPRPQTAPPSPAG